MALKQFAGLFVADNSYGNHGYEALLDFEMSWILRLCARQDEIQVRPNLYHQCRFILRQLTGISIDDYIEEVKVWKQWKHIDIIAEIKVKDDVLHVLVLEDKAYTRMTKTQRDMYPLIVFDYYKNHHTNLIKIIYHFCVISFFDPESDKYGDLKSFTSVHHFGPDGKKNLWWNVFSTSNLPDWDACCYPESDLFNEFWFADWY